MKVFGSLTKEQQDETIKLWKEIGKEQFATPTPEQYLEFITKASKSVAIHYIENLAEAAHRGSLCFDFGHEERIAWHRGVIDNYRKKFGYL